MRSLDLHQEPEERGQVLLHEDLAGAWCASSRQEHRSACGPLTQTLLEHCDRSRETWIHRKALGEIDIRREDLLQGERAVARKRGEPCVHGGRCHGPWNADRHVVAVAVPVIVETELGRPATKAVDRLGSIHAGTEEDDRRDPAEIGEVPFEDVERDARCDPRVNRVAAAFEHLRAGLRCKVVARADHPALPENGGPALRDSDRGCGVLGRSVPHAANDTCDARVMFFAWSGSSRGVSRHTTTAATSSSMRETRRSSSIPRWPTAR